MHRETIAALATPPGLGGVAVIRISGPDTYAIADALTALRRKPSERDAGTFVHAELKDGAGETLDDALMLFFRAPRSYTGEDVVELHVHGGAVVPRRVLERLWALGARPAEPGEFTKRAFLNGRLDLTQAEAVADLIAARSPRAARSARAALRGDLGRRLGALYADVLKLAARTEHLLDFDEGELPPSFHDETHAALAAMAERADRLLATWHEGRLLREGARVVLAGPPNAGKSTLFNLLLGTDRAIVNEQAGTTRDFLEETFLLDGVPVRLTDTAGLRDTADAIERDGVARARDLAGRADVTLCLVPDGDPLPDRLPEGAVRVLTKGDLTHNPDAISVHADPKGAREKICNLLRTALKLTEGASDGVMLANARQYAGLSEAVGALRAADTAFARGDIGYVPAAGHLREAAEALGKLLGRTYADDLLDGIFSRFCVGK